jgi:Protein of unknown function (DUF4013)
MKYLEAYQFPFRSPKWLQNVLYCLVAALVPIVGMMVLLGYQFEIIEALHLRGDKDDYPDFDVNRLLKYLLRGAWPFLVALIVGLPVGLVGVIPLLVSYFGLLISMTPAGGAGNSPWTPVWVVLLIASYLLLLLLQVVGSVIAIPLMLRAGLMQDFGAAFNWNFLRDFLRRMWGPTFLAELFLIFSALVLSLAGMLVFCVGSLFVAPVVQLARAYLFWELYEEYLRRGGTEVELQVQAVEPVTRYGDYQD